MLSSLGFQDPILVRVFLHLSASSFSVSSVVFCLIFPSSKHWKAPGLSLWISPFFPFYFFLVISSNLMGFDTTNTLKTILKTSKYILPALNYIHEPPPTQYFHPDISNITCQYQRSLTSRKMFLLKFSSLQLQAFSKTELGKEEWEGGRKNLPQPSCTTFGTTFYDAFSKRKSSEGRRW